MKIGLLQCDDVPAELNQRHGSFADMIETMLERVDDDVQFQRWDCHRRQLPDSVDAADAWITTGSKSSACDDDRWIHELATFIRELAQARRPLVGICFGHQLIAQALGGHVERSDRGWGVGAYTTQLRQQAPWMAPKHGRELHLLASHQDQVTALPPQGTVLVGNDFCPIYMMEIGDSCLGIQGHPEFTKEFAADLMTLRDDIIPPDRLDSGMNSLHAPLDDYMVAQWIVNFMRQSRNRSDAA